MTIEFAAMDRRATLVPYVVDVKIDGLLLGNHFYLKRSIPRYGYRVAVRPPADDLPASHDLSRTDRNIYDT